MSHFIFLSSIRSVDLRCCFRTSKIEGVRLFVVQKVARIGAGFCLDGQDLMMATPALPSDRLSGWTV